MADENLPPFDATDYPPHYPSSTEAIPVQQPLIVWEKLWSRLRQILSETQQKQHPDINRLAKIVADGYFPKKIPRQQIQQWAASATLLRNWVVYLLRDTLVNNITMVRLFTY